MKLIKRLIAQSVETLIRLACVLALVALVFFCAGVTIPGPLPVMISMSVGQGIGFAACGCYALAVVIDASKRERVAAVSKAPVNEDKKNTDA
jgi:MFS family permease